MFEAVGLVTFCLLLTGEVTSGFIKPATVDAVDDVAVKLLFVFTTGKECDADELSDSARAKQPRFAVCNLSIDFPASALVAVTAVLGHTESDSVFVVFTRQLRSEVLLTVLVVVATTTAVVIVVVEEFVT